MISFRNVFRTGTLLAVFASFSATATEIAVLLGRPDESLDFVKLIHKESVSVDASLTDVEVDYTTQAYSIFHRLGVESVSSVEVLSATGSASSQNFVRGIQAAAVRAPVAFAPFGPNFGPRMLAFCEALGRNPDTVFVLPAGNDGRSIDAEAAQSPECFPANVLRVASLNETGDGLAYFSSFGEKIDLAAGGSKIPVVGEGGKPVDRSGSSISGSIVGARLAVFARLNPSLKGASLARAFLASETQELPALRGKIGGARALKP
jgi:hypothetical protein